LLRSGGIVAIPTETVYGLGASAFDERAVARVFDIKGRPRFDPLIVHVGTVSDLDRLVPNLPEPARPLVERFWPGPLTLVLPKRAEVSDLVTAGCPTVAVRMPDHPVALAIIRAAGVPIAAPSANLFGRISPTTAQHVADQLGEGVDLIVDGGPCRVGIESTVLQVDADRFTLLRPGGISLEEIEAVVGSDRVATRSVSEGVAATSDPPSLPASEPPAGLTSPGTLLQHYAPRTPLTVMWPAGESSPPGTGRLGLLAFKPPAEATGYEKIEVLSGTGNLQEAAARFFAALRRLDAAGLDLILAEPFPEEGLGRALNDRLRRAEHR